MVFSSIPLLPARIELQTSLKGGQQNIDVADNSGRVNRVGSLRHVTRLCRRTWWSDRKTPSFYREDPAVRRQGSLTCQHAKLDETEAILSLNLKKEAMEENRRQ